MSKRRLQEGRKKGLPLLMAILVALPLVVFSATASSAGFQDCGASADATNDTGIDNTNDNDAESTQGQLAANTSETTQSNDNDNTSTIDQANESRQRARNVSDVTETQESVIVSVLTLEQAASNTLEQLQTITNLQGVFVIGNVLGETASIVIDSPVFRDDDPGDDDDDVDFEDDFIFIPIQLSDQDIGLFGLLSSDSDVTQTQQVTITQAIDQISTQTNQARILNFNPALNESTTTQDLAATQTQSSNQDNDAANEADARSDARGGTAEGGECPFELEQTTGDTGDVEVNARSGDATAGDVGDAYGGDNNINAGTGGNGGGGGAAGGSGDYAGAVIGNNNDGGGGGPGGTGGGGSCDSCQFDVQAGDAEGGNGGNAESGAVQVEDTSSGDSGDNSFDGGDSGDDNDDD